MTDVRKAKLINWCQRWLEHYWEAGDRVNANLVSVWLDELTDPPSAWWYRSRVYADPNPFPRFRPFRWLP